MSEQSPTADCDAVEQAFIVWLVETLHYPFDYTFTTPPPVDHGRLADYWNESDGWNISAEEARACIYEEAGLCDCGCPRSMHIGEIGCPCALPGEPPCVTAPAVTSDAKILEAASSASELTVEPTRHTSPEATTP